MAEARHNPWLLSLYILAVIFYLVEIALSSLSGAGYSEIFQSSQTNLSDLYKIDITPANWTFSIWGFIFAWQALWLVYGGTLLFRKGNHGYLYVDPQILSPAFYITFCLSCAFVVTWVFVWDRLFVDVALVALAFTAISLHITQVFGYRQLNKVEEALKSQGLTADIWLTKILVLNGLAFYTTWTSIATCINFAVVMSYSGPYPISTSAASSGALALLMAVIFLWFILKTFVFEKQLRYILSPFIVLVVALTGSLVKNWDRDNGNAIFTAGLLTLVGVLFIITIVRIIIKQCQENKIQDMVTEKILPTHNKEPDVQEMVTEKSLPIYSKEPVV